MWNDWSGWPYEGCRSSRFGGSTLTMGPSARLVEPLPTGALPLAPFEPLMVASVFAEAISGGRRSELQQRILTMECRLEGLGNRCWIGQYLLSWQGDNILIENRVGVEGANRQYNARLHSKVQNVTTASLRHIMHHCAPSSAVRSGSPRSRRRGARGCREPRCMADCLSDCGTKSPSHRAMHEQYIEAFDLHRASRCHSFFAIAEWASGQNASYLAPALRYTESPSRKVLRVAHLRSTAGTILREQHG